MVRRMGVRFPPPPPKAHQGVPPRKYESLKPCLGVFLMGEPGFDEGQEASGESVRKLP